MARNLGFAVGEVPAPNRPEDVKTVQQLLNANIGKLTPLAPLVVDGRIGPATIAAIEEFQRRVVGIAQPDGRVDPHGHTLAMLNHSAPTTASAGTIFVTFQHQNQKPTFPPYKGGIDDKYESIVTVSGGRSGTFRASIYPDDMFGHGRIKDGTYDLYLGFHKRSGKSSDLTDDDLEVRINGLRAALVVNRDHSVPVISDNPAKVTGSSIHVHNGYKGERGSEGCLVLHPSDWKGFIELFLDAYPHISDWVTATSWVGKKLGGLTVSA
jgi:hypothetical protein